MNSSKKNKGFSSPESFFLHFKKHNKFNYDDRNDYWDEFEDLSDHMNWTSSQYSTMKKIFGNLMASYDESEKNEDNENSYDENDGSDEDDDSYENYNDDDNDNDEDDNDSDFDDYFFHVGEYDNNQEFFTKDGDRIIIEKISSLNQYFYLYSKFFGFESNGDISDAFFLFEKLAKFMGWRKRYWYLYYEIQRKEKKADQKQYVIDLFEESETKTTYDNGLDPMGNFEKLAYEMRWKKYYQRKEEFDILVGILSHQKLATLEDLHNILERYGLHKHRPYPKRIADCKHYLKEHLFVNIYDFISDNDRQFENLEALREFTIGHRKYPLELAKSDDVHKILLKQIDPDKYKTIQK